MADTAVPSALTLLPTVLTVSGVLLAPVIGALASLLSRSDLQRKQQEVEYKIKRLEMIEKAISIGKSISNNLATSVDVSLAESEYLRVLKSLPEPEPPSEQDLLPFERHSLPIRLLMIPKPLSISGWIAGFLFYIYLVTAVLTLFIPLADLEVATSTGMSREYDTNLLRFLNPILSLVIAVSARYWAIRTAKATIRHASETFRRETAPEAEAPIVQKS
jgi:hypothetical protein